MARKTKNGSLIPSLLETATIRMTGGPQIQTVLSYQIRFAARNRRHYTPNIAKSICTDMGLGKLFSYNSPVVIPEVFKNRGILLKF